MAAVKLKAHELRRGNVILAVNSNTNLPTMIVLRVRAGGMTIQVDAWNASAWRAETHTLPATAECTIEAEDMPARPTMREALELLQSAATEGFEYDAGSYGAQVVGLLDRARRWGML